MDLTNSNLSSVTIGSHEKTNNAISHKPSVKLYATKVFQGSTIGIVSSIFSTHSKCRRFFKVLLSSLCIAGCIYHCITFLNHALAYPEVVDIYVDRSQTYDWPAYSYCNNNPMRRSVFCSKYPQHCVEPSEGFCKKFSSYCGTNATLVPKKEYYYEMPSSVLADSILKFGSIPNVLSIYSSLKQRQWDQPHSELISEPYLRTPYNYFELKPCYSIHSAIESKRPPIQKTKRVSKESASLNPYEILKFYLNETEMINPKIQPGVYFSVHSPFEAVNPLTKGILLKGGTTYDFYVKTEKLVLLKPPFESNCMDYDELWEKNNRTGPRTKMMCKEKCDLDASVFGDACAHYWVLYPNKETVCGDLPIGFYFDNFSRPLNEVTEKFHDKCLENCRDECRYTKYTTEMTIQDRIKDVKEEEIHRHINVHIHQSNDDIQVLRHSPKYETVDVISSVGGFMGCWLGIALMDILDVFGSIITVCRYAFTKRLYKGNKKASVHII